jgi:hypothetical protein
MCLPKASSAAPIAAAAAKQQHQDHDDQNQFHWYRLAKARSSAKRRANQTMRSLELDLSFLEHPCRGEFQAHSSPARLPAEAA